MSLEEKLYDVNAYKGKVTSLLGTLPTTALRDGNTIPLNQTFKGGTYAGNIPDELLDRGVDQTGND
jgi:hypothetical protein